MKKSEIIINQSELIELCKIEQMTTFGGDRFSEGVFYILGVAFGYLDKASRRGAPPSGKQFR